MTTSDHPRAPRRRGAATGQDSEQRKADQERSEPSATRPGGFQNDPDDATNPNEVRERHLKKLRP